MKNNKKVLAIIPARGGSKGIPKKNIKLLLGKPLIAYSIEASLRSKLVDRTIVSTDNKRIAEIAKKYGAEVPFLRPKDLARDITPTEPVLRHALEWLEKKEGYRPDAVILLQVTSPLRKTEDIEEAIGKFQKGNYDILISVSETMKYFYKLGTEDCLKPIYKKRGRRQDRKPLYAENGAIYITRSLFIKKGKIFGKKIGYSVMDPDCSLEIDNERDLELAEWLIKNY